jgi:hypothetical protein
MTRDELRQAAIAQNDADHAAGKMPTRYVEDEAILRKVALLFAPEGGGADARPAP